MTTSTQASNEFTKQFIQQWMLHKSLQPTPEEVAEFEKENSKYNASTAKSTKEPKPFDYEDIKAGDIRLLALPDEMCYVLVLNKLASSHIVVAFSKFSIPATDDELLISNTRAEYLSVLQLWNVRTMNQIFLRRSWLIDRVTDAELDLAASAVAHTMTGAEFNPEFADRVGMPITNPDDPRSDYKDIMLKRYDALDAVDFDWVMQCDGFTKFVVWRRKSHIDDIITNDGNQYLRIEEPSNRLLRKLRANEDIKIHKLVGKDLNCHMDACGQLVWSSNDAIAPKGFYDVLFIRRNTRTILGSGYADIKYGHTRMVFSDPWPGVDIHCKQDDIVVILCNEATL